MSSSLNVIIFGEVGVGKSSVINLIAGQQVAGTSPEPVACTLSCTPYTLSINDRILHIWDTVGLEKRDMGIRGYPPPIEQAYDLIQKLNQRGGVDLLLFCVKGDQITETTLSNYRLFYEVLCRCQVPIALVVTHLERGPNMENWWDRNADSLERLGIRVAGHACVTGLPTHSRYLDSQRNIIALLHGHRGDGKFNMPPESWLLEFLRLFGLFAPLKEGNRKDIMNVLIKRCHLHRSIANCLADMLLGA